MDDFTIIIYCYLLFIAIAMRMAMNRGRSWLGYGIAAVIISPIIVWIVLWLSGKTMEQKVLEHKEFQDALDNKQT